MIKRKSNQERGVKVTHLDIPVIERLAMMKGFKESYSDILERLMDFYDKHNF